ncbi:hypothetical protein D0466_17430 [Peribacillus glennii]|uniref:Uncharacterized protein n=1 Tax=Peribacillus glennii TaxID=2303991 RepID=A0A372L974_9BACI|nr:hypothetical protein D0466_17430 [Peribacillus glennii]
MHLDKVHYKMSHSGRAHFEMVHIETACFGMIHSAYFEKTGLVNLVFGPFKDPLSLSYEVIIILKKQLHSFFGKILEIKGMIVFYGERTMLTKLM